ncbi:hypothetical protein ACHABX_08925 [Nesterenkonia halotolerans]|uniref:hypothetical protein n=1 Tax=Nesterenkonia halotolerans TaxID=225325 RepID=UPI003EE76C92
MGRIVIMQHGATYQMGLPDAVAKAMNTVVVEHFAQGKGMAIEGLRGGGAENDQPAVPEGHTLTLWVGPHAHVSFTHQVEVDEEQYSTMVSRMSESLQKDNRIHLR